LPTCLRRLGAPSLNPPHQSSYIVNSSLCIYTQSNLFRNQLKRSSFLVILARVHQVFGIEKLCYILYAADYGNYNHMDSIFFVLSPPSPTQFALVSPLCDCFKPTYFSHNSHNILVTRNYHIQEIIIILEDK